MKWAEVTEANINIHETGKITKTFSLVFFPELGNDCGIIEAYDMSIEDNKTPDFSGEWPEVVGDILNVKILGNEKN